MLSSNYLETIWGTIEFRAAHRLAMEDQVARVIIILFGSMVLEISEPDLKSYIDMNTYIESADKSFWEKMHCAMRPIQVKRKNIMYVCPPVCLSVGIFIQVL